MASDRHLRIVELEKKLAVTRAKIEQVEVKAKAMHREFQAASTRAADLMQQAELAEKELTAIKAELSGGAS